MTEETICERNEHDQTCPLAVNITYHNGDRGKSGVKATGYAENGLQDLTRAQVAAVYYKCSEIEMSYEKFPKAREITTPLTQIRLFYLIVGSPLDQLWLSAVGGTRPATAWRASTFGGVHVHYCVSSWD